MSLGSPIILCIETSTKVCSVALTDHEGKVFLSESAEGNDHSSSLTLHIENCLQQANKSISELQAVAISIGPGSYTGLRIGVNVAKGLCYALNIPIIAIDSCEILIAHHTLLEEEVAIGIIDARRMDAYVYIKKYGLNFPSTFKTIDEDFFRELNAHSLVLGGDATSKCIQILEKLAIPFKILTTKSSATLMIGLALEAFHKNNFSNHLILEPNYIKDPNITLSKK
jgi:tRNA threonylcarbamoyladenosine biosynthesis protein TsaB